jgi:hypothetical protein
MAALAAACLTGCISNPHYRPCGPGFMNNLLVPQGFAGTDFRCACQRHDDCYEAGCDRKACDERFYNDMLNACECSALPGLCKLRACQWYAQVRLLGWTGYGNSGHPSGVPGSCGGPPHNYRPPYAFGGGHCEQPTPTVREPAAHDAP